MIAKGRQAIVPVPEDLSLKHASTVGVAGVTAWQSIAPYVESGSKGLINGGKQTDGETGLQGSMAARVCLIRRDTGYAH